MDNIQHSRKRPKAKTKQNDAGDDFKRARAQQDKKKRGRDRKTNWAHFWMVCPKCGGDMFEQESNDIWFDVCRDCHGVYLDHAEINLALKYLDPVKWLKALFRRSKKPNTDLG